MVGLSSDFCCFYSEVMIFYLIILKINPQRFFFFIFVTCVGKMSHESLSRHISENELCKVSKVMI